MPAVGGTGHVYGVDWSPGMLEIARKRCARNKWENVTLLLRHAVEYSLPETVNGVLFSPVTASFHRTAKLCNEHGVGYVQVAPWL